MQMTGLCDHLKVTKSLLWRSILLRHKLNSEIETTIFVTRNSNHRWTNFRPHPTANIVYGVENVHNRAMYLKGEGLLHTGSILGLFDERGLTHLGLPPRRGPTYPLYTPPQIGSTFALSIEVGWIEVALGIYSFTGFRPLLCSHISSKRLVIYVSSNCSSTALNMIFSVKWYFCVTMIAFRMTLLMSKWTNFVMDDGWVHPLAKNPTFSCPQLVMKYCHGWLNFGWGIT